MNSFPIHLLLAEDDPDDCLFFEEALEELPLSVQLTTVYDGEQLMAYLQKDAQILPTVVFMDLNMPRKNGFECLAEIKSNEVLKALPVIVYSTSLDTSTAKLLYSQGAQHYIRKPIEFAKLKHAIGEALKLTIQSITTQPAQEKFIIQI